jgi:hypothetical protein
MKRAHAGLDRLQPCELPVSRAAVAHWKPKDVVRLAAALLPIARYFNRLQQSAFGGDDIVSKQ